MSEEYFSSVNINSQQYIFFRDLSSGDIYFQKGHSGHQTYDVPFEGSPLYPAGSSFSAVGQIVSGTEEIHVYYIKERRHRYYLSEAWWTQNTGWVRGTLDASSIETIRESPVSAGFSSRLGTTEIFYQDVNGQECAAWLTDGGWTQEAIFE